MIQKYREGEVWTYDNRDGESESTLLILQIDRNDDDVTVHVCVDNLAIRNPDVNGKPIDYISHMPFSSEAFENSILRNNGVSQIPDYSEGYECWKEGYEQGNAGVFSVSVGQAVQYMETTINEGVSQE